MIFFVETIMGVAGQEKNMSRRHHLHGIVLSRSYGRD
jgi:hypothetical protein